jgi:hypothetical protein
MIGKENGVEPAFMGKFRQSPVVADIVDIAPVSAPVFPGIGEVSGGVDADIEIEPAFVRAHASTFSFGSVGLPACGSGAIVRKRNSRGFGRELKILAVRRRKTFEPWLHRLAWSRPHRASLQTVQYSKITPFPKGYFVGDVEPGQSGNEFPQRPLK